MIAKCDCNEGAGVICVEACGAAEHRQTHLYTDVKDSKHWATHRVPRSSWPRAPPAAASS
jgi:hypothetical protein